MDSANRLLDNRPERLLSQQRRKAECFSCHLAEKTDVHREKYVSLFGGEFEVRHS